MTPAQYNEYQRQADVVTTRMRIEHLINNTYQVIDNNDTVLFQGSENECILYMLESIKNDMNNNK